MLLTTFLLLVSTEPVSSRPQHPARRASSVNIPSNPDSWKRYVRGPSEHVIQPISVDALPTSGHVLNLRGLVDGSAPTVLMRMNSTDEVPSIVVDFGINTVGILSIEFDAEDGVEGAEDGLPGLRLAFSETIQHLSDKSDFTRSFNAPGGSADALTQGTDQIAVKSSRFTWTNQLGCAYPEKKVCSDGLHGFRYLRISLDSLPEDAPHTISQGTVRIASISLRTSAFLGTPDTFTGNFECSDEGLTQWWYDGVYTNDLCTDIFRANDTEPRGAVSNSLVGKLVLHDGAKRDRDPYVGDLAVAGLTAYLSHDTSEAVRNVLADLADHQRQDGWIPPSSIFQYSLHLFDYTLWWVVASYDYIMYIGDMEYLEKYYPSLLSALDNFYPSVANPDTGLVEKGRADTSGWGDYAFIGRSGPVTYYNALYVHALRRAAELANHLGRTQDSERWTLRADQVSAALRERNFDSEAGLFFDGVCTSDTETTYYCPTHAQDGNSIAILAGVVDAETSRTILRNWADKTAHEYGNAFYDNNFIEGDFADRVYAFISYFEISARFESSLVDSALEETRRLWGYMAARDPGTFWEGVGEVYNSDSFKSMAHGWATGIVALLSRYVLGVTPEAPGFERWKVKPRMGDLSWARGIVPVPGSSDGIRVAWYTEGNRFVLEVNVPEHLQHGIIAVPLSPTQTLGNVRVNTKEVGAEGSFLGTLKDGYLEVEVEGVSFEVVVDG